MRSPANRAEIEAFIGLGGGNLTIARRLRVPVALVQQLRREWGSGFRVQGGGAGFRVQGSGVGVQKRPRAPITKPRTLNAPLRSPPSPPAGLDPPEYLRDVVTLDDAEAALAELSDVRRLTRSEIRRLDRAIAAAKARVRAVREARDGGIP